MNFFQQLGSVGPMTETGNLQEVSKPNMRTEDKVNTQTNNDQGIYDNRSLDSLANSLECQTTTFPKQDLGLESRQPLSCVS